MSDPVEVHPVQMRHHPHEQPVVPAVVSLRAYEVYCGLFGEQPAMITGGSRGGFSVGEIIAFLYARSFPKAEWRQRFDEATHGMKVY